MRRNKALAVGALALALMAPARSAQAQIGGVRFPITSVGDTTLSFALGSARWVKLGKSGIAIDPARRDILVARFRIARVGSDSVTAIITGQTTRVSTSHVVLLQEPPRPWYLNPGFWVGIAGGAALGFAAGSR